MTGEAAVHVSSCQNEVLSRFHETIAVINGAGNTSL